MPFPSFRRRRSRSRTGKSRPQDLESVVSAGTDCGDDEASLDEDVCCSPAPTGPLGCDSIHRGCRVVTYLRDRAGRPYHRGAQCCAAPDTPAWKRHPSVKDRICTRFIDESLGIPTAVTEMIHHPRTEDASRFFCSKQDIKTFTDELAASKKFSTKMRVNGEVKTVGIF